MKNSIWLGILICFFAITSVAQVPITGRRQLKLLPKSTLNSMANEEYQKFLSTHVLCTDAAKVEQVKRVGERIQAATTNYFTLKKQTKYLAGFRWVINVVEENTVNAWCMPGGKIVVYTGLLPVTMNDDALAVVMGHEIAHALANHGNERMSQGLAQQAGGLALSVLLSNRSPETQNLFLKAYGVGTNLGAMLPFSRLHESEADEIGLCLMAMAGYNPEEAIGFWQRMDKANGTASVPQILSTHPSDKARIDNLQKLMPKARAFATKYGLK